MSGPGNKGQAYVLTQICVTLKACREGMGPGIERGVPQPKGFRELVLPRKYDTACRLLSTLGWAF